jgi:hypothetical protein
MVVRVSLHFWCKACKEWTGEIKKSLVLGKYEHTTAVCAATLRAKSSELLPKVTHELVLLNPEKLEKPLETAT